MERGRDAGAGLGGGRMAQYCRYCSALVVGNIAYCTTKKKEIQEHLAKTTNYCPHYDLNPIDAFGENKKGYQPRNAKVVVEQCDGQMDISYFLGEAQDGQEETGGDKPE